MLKNDYERFEVEKKYLGVHEFKPQVRGEAFTKQFMVDHPESIKNYHGRVA